MEVIYRATGFNHDHADEIVQAGAGAVQWRTTTMSRCILWKDELRLCFIFLLILSLHFESSFTLLFRQLSKPAKPVKHVHQLSVNACSLLLISTKHQVQSVCERIHLPTVLYINVLI